MASVANASEDVLGSLQGGAKFWQVFGSEAARAAENDGSVSIALVDIDQFGQLNDEHGDKAGDEVLRLVASRLHGIGIDGRLLFRYNFREGGDEFILVFPGIEKEQAFLALEREREGIYGEHEIEIDGRKLSVKVSVSAAVATYPEDGSRPQDVMRKANDALYRAKSGGRNRVCLAKEEKMVTKTSHYTQGQLARLSQLAKRERVGEAELLREALDEVLRKYGV